MKLSSLPSQKRKAAKRVFYIRVSGWQDLDNPNYIFRWKYKSEGLNLLYFLFPIALQTVFKMLLYTKKVMPCSWHHFCTCRDDRIWTCDLSVPNGVRYRTAPHPDCINYQSQNFKTQNTVGFLQPLASSSYLDGSSIRIVLPIGTTSRIRECKTLEILFLLQAKCHLWPR